MREREFISLQQIAEQEYAQKKEELQVAMRKRMTETNFEAAENGIRGILEQEEAHRMFGVENPWYKKLPLHEQADLLIKYPKYAY